MATWELYAHGRVQGVGFRWHVQRTALQLGIHGYVRNLFNGSVYIIAEAEEYVLDQFRAALLAGTRSARVDSLETNIIDSAKKYHDFEIK